MLLSFWLSQPQHVSPFEQTHTLIRTDFLPAAQRHGHNESGMVGRRFRGHFGPVGLDWGLFNLIKF